MKKLILLLLLFSGIYISVSAQNIELKVTKDSTIVNGSYRYAIDLTILGDKAPYNIDIYDNRPCNGGKVIASKSNYNLSKAIFDNLAKIETLYISVECINERRGVTTMIRL